MSTRSNIIVDDGTKRICIYRHYDGSPSAVLPDIQKAAKFAWKLPRFEADDFSAAIVAAWKTEGGGGVYIDGTDINGDQLHGDIDYHYEVHKTPTGELIAFAYDSAGDEVDSLIIR